MAPNFDLAMHASGSHDEGLGHLLRSAAIAQEAVDAGLKVGFFLMGDDFAQTVATRELPGVKVEHWSPDEFNGGPSTSWTVFDTRHPIAGCLERRNSRALVLDRLDCADLADLTIMPAFHNAPIKHPRVLQGAQYCVLADCVRNARPADPSRAPVVIVSLGGADPLHLSERVAVDLFESLRSLSAADPVEIHFVLGPAFGERHELEERLRSYVQSDGWKVERAPTRADFAGLLSRACLAVLGFGTAIYEAAYLGVPVVYLPHQQSDDACAMRLEALGLGRYGTSGTRYDPAALRSVLEATLADPDWRRAASERSREALGSGRGARRILEEMGFAPASHPSIIHPALDPDIDPDIDPEMSPA